MGASTIMGWTAAIVGNIIILVTLWRVMKSGIDASDHFQGKEIDLRDKKIEELESKLDIIRRCTEGEWQDPCFLANDYGGTGWENDPAVKNVGVMCRELSVHKNLMREQDPAYKKRFFDELMKT